MTRFLSIIAVILSGAALAVSLLTASQADSRAEDALRKRELAAVQRLKPDLMKIYEDFDMELPPASLDPQDLDDLLWPLVKLIQSVSK